MVVFLQIFFSEAKFANELIFLAFFLFIFGLILLKCENIYLQSTFRSDMTSFHM